MNQAEELDFVHSFLPGRSTRTLLLPHGTGGDENGLIPLGRELDPDANLLKSLPDNDDPVLAPPFVGIWSSPWFLARFGPTIDEQQRLGPEHE